MIRFWNRDGGFDPDKVGICPVPASTMSLYIDGLLDTANANKVAQHLRTCDNCERCYASFLAVQQVLRDRPIASPPADLALRISTALRRENDVKPRFVTYVRRTAFAAAASIVALGSILWMNYSHGAFTATNTEPTIISHPDESRTALRSPAPEATSTEPLKEAHLAPPIQHTGSPHRVKPERQLVAQATPETAKLRVPRLSASVVAQTAPTRVAISVKPKLAVMPLARANARVALSHPDHKSAGQVHIKQVVADSHVPTPDTHIVPAPHVVDPIPATVPTNLQIVAHADTHSDGRVVSLGSLYQQHKYEARVASYNPSRAIRDDSRSSSPSEPIVGSGF